MAEILERRAVFAVDGSAGYNSFFLNSSFSGNHFGRLGAWLTLSYAQVLNKESKDKSYVNFYALGRHASDGKTIINGRYTVQGFFDFGRKLELEFKNISVAYEYIYRINDNTNTFCSNALVKYKISDRLFFQGPLVKILERRIT